MSEWTDIGDRASLDPDTPLAGMAGDVAVGVFEVDGTLHAIEDICPHAHAHLSQGFADGCEIECPLHGAVFDVTSGKHLRGEPCSDVKTFPVRVVAGRVQVQR